MGDAATRVQERLREHLSGRCPELRWETEYTVGGTPVDVAGVGTGGTGGERLALVELEWRRADPADNTAKLFRHLVNETVDAEAVALVQVFTDYYALTSGGVSSKRLNAEFVGERVALSLESVEYYPLTLALDPPKRGASLPDAWRSTVEETGDEIVARVEWVAGV